MEATTESMRNVGLFDLEARLRALHRQKLDAVVPSTSLVIDDEGQLQVDMGAGFTPATTSRQFDRQIAGRLGIPLQYADRMRTDAPDLYAANVNGWLQRDQRRFLARSYRNGSLQMRALLSDSFRLIDNINVLYTVLNVLDMEGLNVDVKGSDLSETKMHLKIDAPELQVDGGALFDKLVGTVGGVGHADPNRTLSRMISAGIVVQNSEIGQGAAQIAPRLTMLVCVNGYVWQSDALRHVHIGAKLESGLISWSNETRRANEDLIAAQTKDAVKTFLSKGYVERKVAELEAHGTREVENPEPVITGVANELSLSEERRSAIMSKFIKGGDTTRFGVVQAITAYAQDEPDPDVANELEAQAVAVLPKIGTFDVRPN